MEGLAEQVEHLGQRSDSFWLPAFRKWARLLTDPGNAKGWPKVFADRARLFHACVSVYETWSRRPGGTAGRERGLFAEFLDEAAGLLDAPPLGKAAAAYREAADRWHEVAEVALPAGREPFAEARRLTDRLQAQVEGGDAAQQEAAATAAALWALRDRWRPAVPGRRRRGLRPAGRPGRGRDGRLRGRGGRPGRSGRRRAARLAPAGP